MIALACCYLAFAPATSAEEAESKHLSLRHLFTHIPRPDPEGVPTEVQVAAHLIDLKAIDDVAQTFTADVYMAATWNDPRLALGPHADRESIRVFQEDEIWNPDLDIVNRGEVVPLMEKMLRVDSDGTVTQLQRLLGTFSVSLDLRDFPFDTQVMPIAVSSFFYGPDEIDLKTMAASFAIRR